MGKPFFSKGETAAADKTAAAVSSVVADDSLLNVLDHFIHQENMLLTKLQEDKSNAETKKKILQIAEQQFRLQLDKKQDIEAHVKKFERYLWGYYILDDLINDKEISDIKCYTEDNIRIKRHGKRMAAPANIRFQSKGDYKRLVSMAAVKNQINISTLNALQTFTDTESSPDFILRCDICTEYINSHKYPVLQIRKIPKYKNTLEELVKMDVMTPEQAAYLKRKVPVASGMFFTGKGSSGKTTVMNSLFEYIPHDMSGLAIQENPELFSKSHPDFLFQRIRRNNGENRIQYELGDLAKNGLILDIDYFIIGEIKGSEAAEFAQCSYTGYKCWATGHGQNERDGLYKLADNVKRATGYEFTECLRMLTGIEVVAYMKDFQVAGIAEVKGYDAERRDLIFETVDLPVPQPRNKAMGGA